MSNISEAHTRIKGLFSPQQEALSEGIIYDTLGEISEIINNSKEKIFPVLSQSDRWLLSHEIFSKEYYEVLGKFILSYREKNPRDKFSILEIGAGNGEFSKHLRKEIGDIPLYTTDPNKNTPDVVEKLTYIRAIHMYKPTLVIAVWPYIMRDNTGKSTFFQDLANVPSIEGCILIGVPDRCEFGWEDFEEYTWYWKRDWPFLSNANLYELSKLQIWLKKWEKWPHPPLKSGINPLLVRDQGIASQIQAIPSTFITSRTHILLRSNDSKI